MKGREWEVWDDEYVQVLIEDWWAKEPKMIEFLENYTTLVNMMEGFSILDVACGVGHLAGVVPGGVRYIGVDNSDAMLRVARERHPNMTFIKGDAFTLKGITPSDTVIASALLFHLPEVSEVINTLWSKTRQCLIFDVCLHTKTISNDREVLADQHREFKFPKGKYKIWRRVSLGKINEIIMQLEDIKEIRIIPHPDYQYLYTYKITR